MRKRKLYMKSIQPFECLSNATQCQQKALKSPSKKALKSSSRDCCLLPVKKKKNRIEEITIFFFLQISVSFELEPQFLRSDLEKGESHPRSTSALFFLTIPKCTLLFQNQCDVNESLRLQFVGYYRLSTFC